MGIMENKMETNLGFRVYGSAWRRLVWMFYTRAESRLKVQ